MLPRNYINDLYFMQDNALIYITNKVKKWFKDNGIDTSDWPPYSPDLNPIEHAWKKLKEVVMEHFPEVWDTKGESEEELRKMEEVLKQAWLIIPTSFFKSLIESMERRIKAVIAADSWHTKY
jgi:DDE superfamily endonuclease